MGLIIGAVLMMSGQLYAAAPLIGKKVANTVSVKLNGKSIGSGIIVDSTTYLPVRTVATALNLQTTYQSGVVTVTGEENAKQAAEQQAQTDALTADFNKINSKYFDLLTKVDQLQALVKGYEEKIVPEWEKKVADMPSNPINAVMLNQYKAEMKSKKDDLKSKTAELQTAKAAVDAFVFDHPEYEKFIAKLPTA